MVDGVAVDAFHKGECEDASYWPLSLTGEPPKTEHI